MGTQSQMNEKDAELRTVIVQMTQRIGRSQAETARLKKNVAGGTVEVTGNALRFRIRRHELKEFRLTTK